MQTAGLSPIKGCKVGEPNLNACIDRMETCLAGGWGTNTNLVFRIWGRGIMCANSLNRHAHMCIYV